MHASKRGLARTRYHAWMLAAKGIATSRERARARERARERERARARERERE